jgi:cytoplasmic iron level regulating protein YaaA (DUF328/UPF0246 family)
VVAGALLSALSGANEARRSVLVNARGGRLEPAIEVTRRSAEGVSPVLPSWRRYEGVVWAHLDPGTLEVAQRRRLLVPSALYGFSFGDEPIGEYRLKFTVALEGLSSLAAYWRPWLGEALDSLGAVEVVDLLPLEHHRAIDWSLLTRPRVRRVNFLSADRGSVVGHDAKAAKGAFARHLLTEGVAGLESFRWRGWASERVGEEYVVVAPASRDAHRPVAPRFLGSVD